VIYREGEAPAEPKCMKTAQQELRPPKKVFIFLSKVTKRFKTMQWIKESLQNGDVLAGTFLLLDAGCVGELAGRAGLDWVVVDTEHSLGDHQALVSILQATRIGKVSPIVRVIVNEPQYFKKALDLGAAGVMVPQINTAEEAKQAVRYAKYPPEGIRGLARGNWAGGFGYEIETYLAEANCQGVVVIQIETRSALDHVEEIAAVDGVDALFIGPADLSCNLGIPCDLDHPELTDALDKIRAAAAKHGKATGIYIRDDKDLKRVIADGFQLIALSTDQSILKYGMQKIADAFKN